MCVCVCVRERERERGIVGKKESDDEKKGLEKEREKGGYNYLRSR